jgi:uncharacterized protein YaeQ
MMMRLLAFALNAHERLVFGKGLSDTDEPDLWQKDLTGRIVHWIDVGQPGEKRLIRATGRADRVTVYTYGRRTEPWLKVLSERLANATNFSVWRISADKSEAVATLASRNMQLQCTVQEEQVWFSTATLTIHFEMLNSHSKFK